MTVEVQAPATLPVEEIKVVDRHRRDLGDLTGLAESIAERGLLHPIVVTPTNRLVAGQRRLEACRSLGWTEVPVTITGSLTEARALLEAERDENTCRLDMRPSEKVALGRALEALERPRAAERRLATLKQGDSRPENFSERGPKDRSGDTRELVGGAVGMSGPTYERARTVVERAEEGDPVAIEAARQMDETGKVTPAFEKVIGRSIESQSKQAQRGNGTRDGSRKRRPQELVGNVIEKLRGISAALEQIDTAAAISADVPLAEWDKNLTEIIVPLHRLRGDIRKVLNNG